MLDSIKALLLERFHFGEASDCIKVDCPIGFTGEIKTWPLKFTPRGYLPCDGSAVARALYPDLFNTIAPKLGNFTITIATPAVVTLTAHGLTTGDPVFLNTSGALPTGLAQNTLYYVVYLTANTFSLATSFANAHVPTKINTSGSQSGVHTISYCPWGLGDGTTTFNVPTTSGRSLVGVDASQAEFDAVGLTGGAKTTSVAHTHTGPSHRHTQTQAFTDTYVAGNGLAYTAGGTIPNSVRYTGYDGTGNTGAMSANGTPSILQPYAVFKFIIKV